MKIQEIEQRCADIIKSYLPNEKWHIWLFGSQAKGTASSRSDVDIAICGDTEVPWDIMSRIRDKINEIRTLRSIDLLDIHCVDSSLSEQIFRHGKKIA